MTEYTPYRALPASKMRNPTIETAYHDASCHVIQPTDVPAITRQPTKGKSPMRAARRYELITLSSVRAGSNVFACVMRKPLKTRSSPARETTDDKTAVIVSFEKFSGTDYTVRESDVAFLGHI